MATESEMDYVDVELESSAASPSSRLTRSLIRDETARGTASRRSLAASWARRRV